MALKITELKKGTIFRLGDEVYRVVDYAQKVIGRGGSIVNVRIKNVLDGRVQERTFKGNEQLEKADVTRRDVQYLYSDGTDCHFMDNDSYEQFSLPVADLDDKTGFMKNGGLVTAQLLDGRLINVELPKNMPLQITYTEDVVKGDTSNAITKNATLETGAIVKVPAFIKQGDIISVDTATGAYRGRST